MRILACIPFHYYESLSVPLSYYYVVDTLRRLGHSVHLFEFVEQGIHNKEGMNDFFLSAVRRLGYDLVFVETAGDEFLPDVLDEARRHTVTLAWNSDDDWRWEDYSSRWCSHYSYMVTTYRRVYDANKEAHPNLLLSQWACTGLFDGLAVQKDINVSFVGGIYGDRVRLLAEMRRSLGLEVFSRNPLSPQSWAEKTRRKVARLLYGAPLQAQESNLTYSEVNGVWNRSRVSLTPLEASRGGGLQVKGRVFEMGCSGTVMLSTRNPELHEFYEPGREFVEYDSLSDCCDKARFLLAHEGERARIADAYYRRTKAEHMWALRYEKLFREIGLPA